MISLYIGTTFLPGVYTQSVPHSGLPVSQTAKILTTAILSRVMSVVSTPVKNDVAGRFVREQAYSLDSVC